MGHLFISFMLITEVHGYVATGFHICFCCHKDNTRVFSYARLRKKNSLAMNC